MFQSKIWHDKHFCLQYLKIIILLIFQLGCRTSKHWRVTSYLGCLHAGCIITNIFFPICQYKYLPYFNPTEEGEAHNKNWIHKDKKYVCKLNAATWTALKSQLACLIVLILSCGPGIVQIQCISTFSFRWFRFHARLHILHDQD